MLGKPYPCSLREVLDQPVQYWLVGRVVGDWQHGTGIQV